MGKRDNMTNAVEASQRRAAAIRQGQEKRAQQGHTPHRVPLGYLNRQRVDAGVVVRDVIVDRKRRRFIAEAFRRFATGRYTVAELAGMLAQKGLTTRGGQRKEERALTRADLRRLLQNVYYTGVVRWRGVSYPGVHQPLVDDATFAQVQQVLADPAAGRR